MTNSYFYIGTACLKSNRCFFFERVREQHEQNREAMLKALLQPAINRDVLKQCRQSELQLIDSVSTRLVDSVADVADVLTLEQRSQLAEYVSRMRR